jgi:acyl dehydratase
MTATIELPAMPAPGSLYRRVALSSLRRPGGTDLPDLTVTVRKVTADVDRLAAYNRVCGYRLRDVLPGTYPHVLAFPLAVRLMSEPEFPFPAIGLIHVADRIMARRSLRLGESMDLSVRAINLRPHQRGYQFEIVAIAEIDGAEAWRSEATYLRRMNASSGGDANDGQGEKTDGEPTAVWRVGREVGRAYAAVSGDRNPIHVSRVGARLLGFRRPIAHGMWTMTRCLATLEAKIGAAYAAEVTFGRPISLPSTVAFRARQTDDGYRLNVAAVRGGRPHLTGTVVNRRP